VSSYVRWQDIRAEQVERAGGEAVVAAGKAEPLAQVVGQRLAEVRRARGFTQSQIAERMGVTKGRVSQIERGRISGQDVLARYAAALGGRLHQAIYFDDGDIAAIA
jgi:DNA-binding XRE family transcriptional regulator